MTAQRLQTALSALALASAALLSPAAQAQVVNGQFTAGLAGWTTLGDASVAAANAADPTRLWLTTASATEIDDADSGLPAGARNVSGVSAADIGALEPFVGVPAYGLDTAQGAATEGSAAQQSFTAAAGSTLSFRWDLGTLDTSGDPTLADQAVVVIDGQATTLATILAATLAGTDGNAAHTGWLDFSTTFASGGTHTLSFGIVDIGDYLDTSTLAIADVTLTPLSAVPESSTLALMAAGLALVGLKRRRRSL